MKSRSIDIGRPPLALRLPHLWLHMAVVVPPPRRTRHAPPLGVIFLGLLVIEWRGEVS
jgi:hypothetical protein